MVCAWLIFIASAASVNSQSNLNCSLFNRTAVPGGFAPLINLYQGNNSHAEYGNLTNYNFTMACGSNVTTINQGCSNNYVDVLQLYNYTDAHVSVNDYYTRSVCFNTTDTSLVWYLDVSAGSTTPADYECLFVLSNLSNSHVYECGHPDANYTVNLRLASPSLGSIIIVGPNGTGITGTRNVYLNITYQANVVACRWANDNKSNLNSALWENCTTVKPWILSEAEGSKTVYFQVMNSLGINTTFNDSITYRFLQDYTAPTAPVVYDSDTGYDIDWWNDNTTLSAYWWNSTDDISENIYYRYRIMNDTGCYNNDCNWTEIGKDSDVTVEGLSLAEGTNYSFQVIAYNDAGFNSSIASSNGTVIDLTDPTALTINSTTHPSQNDSFGNSTALFNFTAIDPVSNGVASGIEGYSYLLDQHPGTAPDDNLEARQWQTVSAMQNNGYGQLLRANSTIGSPNTYAVFTQLKANFTENDSIRVRVALAELVSDYDDLMGVKVYLINISDGASVSSFNNEASAFTTIANISRDIRYAGSMKDAAVYEFSLTATQTVDDDSTYDIYAVVTGLTADNDNRHNLSIAGSTSSIDSSTRNFVCDDTGSCDENTTTLEYAIEVQKQDAGDEWNVRYDNLQDGTYYFHAKAKDRAGNWGDPEHYRMIVDTEGVAVGIASPFTGQLFSDEHIDVDIEVDDQANVTVFVMHEDGSNYTSQTVLVNDTYTFNVTLENGSNEIYAEAVNPINNVVSYSQKVFVRLGVDLPESNKTLRVSYSGAGNLGTHIRGVDDSSLTVGIATENDQATFGTSSIQSETDFYTIKIFATRTGAELSDVDDELDDDEFLDREVPLFGYEKGVPDYIISTEMRPVNIHFEGEKKIGSGKYTFVFKNVGITADGKANISVRII